MDVVQGVFYFDVFPEGNEKSDKGKARVARYVSCIDRLPPHLAALPMIIASSRSV